MYILKNALKSILRAKGRNILVCIIVIMIAVASCVALSINNSAAEIVANQKENTPITATINTARISIQRGQDGEDGVTDFRDMLSNRPELTIEDIKLYGTSEYVESYTYSISGTINASEIEAYSEESDSDTDTETAEDSNQTQGGPQRGGGFNFGGFMASGDFTITGYSDLTAMSDFVEGTSEITEGSVFTAGSDAYECVISDELVAFNEQNGVILEVGDTIKLVNPSNEEEAYEFKIVGIYHNDSSSETQSQMRFSTAMDPANQIYVSYEAYAKMVSESETLNSSETAETTEETETTEATAAAADSTDDTSTDTESDAEVNPITGTLSCSYTLTGLDDVEAFESDVVAKGMSEDYFAVSTNAESVESELAGIESLNDFSKTFLLVVILVGGLILVIINLINIRERKYEVGVLTAIGMKKGKVAAQFIAELFVVTFIALIIGTSIGAVVSVPTASAMLESQISAQESQQEETENNFGDMPGGGSFNFGGQQGGGGRPTNMGGLGDSFGLNQDVNYIDQIDAVISGKVLLELFGIGLLLTLISSGVAIVFISRYSPLKILSERA